MGLEPVEGIVGLRLPGFHRARVRRRGFDLGRLLSGGALGEERQARQYAGEKRRSRSDLNMSRASFIGSSPPTYPLPATAGTVRSRRQRTREIRLQSLPGVQRRTGAQLGIAVTRSQKPWLTAS